MSSDEPTRDQPTGDQPTQDSGHPHPEFERRRRNVARVRGRRRRLAVFRGVGAVVCVLAGYWLATGPVLTINSVTVKNYSGPDAAQLQSELSAAASHGGSLLSPPVRTMTAVAQRFPGIETINVSRDWPFGLTVTVVPAGPFAIVTAPGQRSVVVSNRGLVMAPASRNNLSPSIALSQPIPAFGRPLPSWAMQTLGFLALVRPQTRPRIKGLSYLQGELIGQLSNGPVLILGTLALLPEKAAALNAVLSHVSPRAIQNATYFDITVPSRPALGTGPLPAGITPPSTQG